MRDTQVRLGKDSIGKGSINNNVGRKMSHFTPPTVEEVQEYCFERGNAVDAQSFVDFYTSKGWYVGKTKMKDWSCGLMKCKKSVQAKLYSEKDTESQPPCYGVWICKKNVLRRTEREGKET